MCVCTCLPVYLFLSSGRILQKCTHFKIHYFHAWLWGFLIPSFYLFSFFPLVGFCSYSCFHIFLQLPIITFFSFYLWCLIPSVHYCCSVGTLLNTIQILEWEWGFMSHTWCVVIVAFLLSIKKYLQEGRMGDSVHYFYKPKKKPQTSLMSC